jgi:hypothetical protein
MATALLKRAALLAALDIPEDDEAGGTDEFYDASGCAQIASESVISILDVVGGIETRTISRKFARLDLEATTVLATVRAGKAIKGRPFKKAKRP